MPIYTFKCDKCGEKKDRLVKSDVKEVKCDKCDGDMKRELSAPNVKFVGSGFYETDYKNK